MLNVKQGGIKYHFLSLWYDLTWDWTPISRTIGEHSNNPKQNNQLTIDIYWITTFNWGLFQGKSPAHIYLSIYLSIF